MANSHRKCNATEEARTSRNGSMATHVADGAVVREEYVEGPLRVLHLLKQPTQRNPSLSRVILDCLERGTFYAIWRRVAERSYCLHNAGCPWQELRDRHEDERDVLLAAALRRSAVVNLENRRTDRSTTDAILRKWAINNIGRWHGRILELKPNVVVCGGTADAVWRAFGQYRGMGKQKYPYERLSTGMWYFRDPELARCVYIAMNHPSALYPMNMCYTFLAATTPEILSMVKA